MKEKEMSVPNEYSLSGLSFNIPSLTGDLPMAAPSGVDPRSNRGSCVDPPPYHICVCSPSSFDLVPASSKGLD